MKITINKVKIILCLLAIAFMCTCSDSDNGRYTPDFAMPGIYVFQVNTNESTWVFNSDKTYQCAEYGATAVKSGTWSSSGNDVTISYEANGGWAVSGTEVFTGKKEGDQVTLTLKNNSAQSSLLLGSFGLSNKTVTLKRIGDSYYYNYRYTEIKIINDQLTEDKWKEILTDISQTDKIFVLDLSLCTRSTANTGGGLRADGTFDPIYFEGKGRIKSLILPNATANIKGNFYYFDLFRLSFPASVNIIDNPFTTNDSVHYLMINSFFLTGSGSLSTIEDDKALVINNSELIAYPSASGNITLNDIIIIRNGAFKDCKNLTSVSSPKATSIGDSAFYYCESLTSVSFPELTSIGGGAFGRCTSLTSVSFPKATSIGGMSFYMCHNLTSISIPEVTSIGAYAFYGINTTSLIIILGSSAPTLGGSLFNLASAQTVTVKVPSGATGYGTIPATYSGSDVTVNWGNGFRGGGWTGTAFGEGYLNVDITLNVIYQ